MRINHYNCIPVFQNLLTKEKSATLCVVYYETTPQTDKSNNKTLFLQTTSITYILVYPLQTKTQFDPFIQIFQAIHLNPSELLGMTIYVIADKLYKLIDQRGINVQRSAKITQLVLKAKIEFVYQMYIISEIMVLLLLQIALRLFSTVLEISKQYTIFEIIVWPYNCAESIMRIFVLGIFRKDCVQQLLQSQVFI
ncbi:hypothetical protein ABPG72_000809 [Tetrahymena utriculariae]